MNFVYEELRLKSRYLLRRIGSKNHEVHQICLPEQKLIYIPIPKNVSTSIKHALFEIKYDKKFSSFKTEKNFNKDHHDYFLKRRDAFSSVNSLSRKKEYFKFTVIREPIKRIISCYRNRILDLRDLEKNSVRLKRLNLSTRPTLDEFIMNLEKYRKVSNSVAHHTKSQSLFLGKTLKYLDRIYTFEELDELKKMLRVYKNDMKLYRRKTGGTKIELKHLSPKSLQKLLHIYAEDYHLFRDFYKPVDIKNEYKRVLYRD